MTVKQRINNGSDFDIRKSDQFSDEMAGKRCSRREFERFLSGKSKVKTAEIEADQESAESSEEMESPRSVERFGRSAGKKIGYVHSQILRIREEDLQLGLDVVGEGLSGKVKISGNHHQEDPYMDFVIFSRPILPASPLGGKTAITSFH